MMVWWWYDDDFVVVVVVRNWGSLWKIINYDLHQFLFNNSRILVRAYSPRHYTHHYIQHTKIFHKHSHWSIFFMGIRISRHWSSYVHSEYWSWLSSHQSDWSQHWPMFWKQIQSTATQTLNKKLNNCTK